MLKRCVSTYLLTLLIFSVISSCLSLLMFVTAVLNIPFFMIGHSPFTLYSQFVLFFLAFGVAKDRNIWKHEFLQCPLWMRVISCSTFFAGFFAALICVLFLPRNSGRCYLLVTSDFQLVFSFMSTCVPFALLKKEQYSDEEIGRRIVISFLMILFFSVLFCIDRSVR